MGNAMTLTATLPGFETHRVSRPLTPAECLRDPPARRSVRDQLTFLQDASAAVKAEAQAGKCWDPVEKELKLPKYESWAGYETALPFVLRRYCGLWGRGT